MNLRRSPAQHQAPCQHGPPRWARREVLRAQAAVQGRAGEGRCSLALAKGQSRKRKKRWVSAHAQGVRSLLARGL